MNPLPMKRITVITILFCCFCTAVGAQTAANYYNNGKAFSNQANEMLGTMASFDKPANDKIIGLYKSSSENYLKARDMMSGLKYLAGYNAAMSLYRAAVQCRAANDDSKAYDLMK